MLFSEIIGQRETKEHLLHAASDGRISHAQLFLGNEGSGNFALALAYAQYLFCENRSDSDSCGVCASCRKVEKLVHPDLTFSFPMAANVKEKIKICADLLPEFREAVSQNPYLSYNEWVTSIDAENKQGIINVEEAADIVHRLGFRSVEGGYKICIIWYPESLHISAANKLLKIIEEPPEDTLFLLVAENHGKILPTISSRTQLIKINAVTDAEMWEGLQSKHQLSVEEARSIAHRADGSYNKALHLLQEQSNDDYSTQFLEWMRQCLKLRVSELTEFCETMASQSREQQKIFLQYTLYIARECILINYGDLSMVRLSEQDLSAYRKFAPFVNKSNVDDFVEEVNKAHFHLERNANPRILFTDLSFALHRLLKVK